MMTELPLSYSLVLVSNYHIPRYETCMYVGTYLPTYTFRRKGMDDSSSLMFLEREKSPAVWTFTSGLISGLARPRDCGPQADEA